MLLSTGEYNLTSKTLLFAASRRVKEAQSPTSLSCEEKELSLIRAGAPCEPFKALRRLTLLGEHFCLSCKSIVLGFVEVAGSGFALHAKEAKSREGLGDEKLLLHC